MAPCSPQCAKVLPVTVRREQDIRQPGEPFACRREGALACASTAHSGKRRLLWVGSGPGSRWWCKNASLPKHPMALARSPAPTTHRCRSARTFEIWLRKHHSTSEGVWLEIAKPGAPEATVSYAEAVEVAICYGWIDGQKKALNAMHWLQRFTPRRSRSIWSKVNRAKAEALIAAGRMHPSGQAEIDRAKADGRWDAAYDGARTAAVPADLQAALDAQPKAGAFFSTLDAANRYSVLWRVQTAKKPETRARRIEGLVAMLTRGEKIHP